MIEINATARLFLALGTANAALAVVLGAFGAHALKAKLSENLMAVYHTANEYHFYHAFGLLVIGIIAMLIPVNFWVKLAGWSMFFGIVLFCVSLYALVEGFPLYFLAFLSVFGLKSCGNIYWLAGWQWLN